MAANGIMYRVWFDNQSITNAAQDIIVMAAAAAIPILVHSVKLTISPTITSGVAQDVRAQLRWLARTTAGSGGSAVTPTAVNPRNTLAAAGTYTQLRTTPGTAGTQGNGELVSIIVPYERVFTADQRFVIPGGTSWALNLEAGLGAAYSASLEAYVEEI
jgi:hypothetical protein